MRLEDKTIVVTGAAAGLGEAMTRAFASEGARVVCADIDEEGLNAVVADLSEDGATAIAVPTDVRSWEEVRHLVDTTHDAFGAIDVLVNNAGVQQRTAGADDRYPVVDVPVDIWTAVVETNLTGPFLCSKAALPDMLDRGRGRLIHVSSGAGGEAKPNRSPYVSSKFGLEGFHETLALELEGTGVESVTLRPPGGGVYTESRPRPKESFAFESADIIAEPAVRIASGEGENGGRYVGTEDGDGYTEYARVPE